MKVRYTLRAFSDLDVIRYPYRIYYRIAAGEVLILHIRHAARRPLRPGEI
jgi:hypothetical protein